MITCPICKTEYNENALQKWESDCHFLPVSGISQHLVRYRCNICDVIFGPEDMLHLSEKKLSQAYLDEYASGTKEMDSTEWEYDIFLRLNPNSNGNYINWGAGLSKTSVKAKRNGFQLINYDPGMPIELAYASLNELPKADGILSNNVLDHLQDPIKDLLVMKSLLKPGGCMIHSSDGFMYNIHFTKYHLYFFVGKSVERLAKAVDMNYEFLPCRRPDMKILKLTRK